mgnify:CR=1 FL=1
MTNTTDLRPDAPANLGLVGKKKYAVMTTINEPRGDFLRAVASTGWELVVVADTKTPNSWQGIEGIHYLSLELQKSLYPELYETIPFGNYARKNFGFLYAAKSGATGIWELDDDNFPFNCPFDVISQCTQRNVLAEKWANIYDVFYPGLEIWPRGFPLSRVRDAPLDLTYSRSPQSAALPQVVQFMVDGEADVDAICRLVHRKYQVPVESQRELCIYQLVDDQRCPMNTQNTLWIDQNSWDFLYHPHSVKMRFSDILKMFVTQQFCGVGFGPSTVVQDRNVHSLLDDFEGEFEMYVRTEELVALLETSDSSLGLGGAYGLLEEHNFVSKADRRGAQLFTELMRSALGKN